MNLAIDDRLAWLAEMMNTLIPFNRHLGLYAVHLQPGEAVLHLPWRDEFLGYPDPAAMHGGIISTVLDTAGGAAVFSRFQGPEDRCSTVDLRVDYLRPGPPEDLYAHARVLRFGNRVAVTRTELFAGTPPGEGARAIATGQAVYNIVRGGGIG